jgi:hypothetical protein
MRLPHLSASSTVWLAHKIAASGLFAINQHGNKRRSNEIIRGQCLANNSGPELGLV